MSKEPKWPEGPWVWGKGWHEVNGKNDGIEGGGPKYADLSLCNLAGEVILPLEIDHYDLVWNQHPIFLSKAKRDLIAAAPDMANELEELIRLAGNLLALLPGLEEELADVARRRITKARAALAKARGEPS